MSFSISAERLTKLPSEPFTRTPEGESAILVVEKGIIHPEFAARMPLKTRLAPMTSSGERHVYSLEVRGYTVAEFVEIAKTYILATSPWQNR